MQYDPTTRSNSRQGKARMTLAAALLATFAWVGAAQAQPYVNLTVGGQFSPGVFGQVQVGNAPPPPVYNPQPIIVGNVIQGAPVIYMHVPEHEQRRWHEYCGRYNACGRPVHFVRVEDNNRWWEDRRSHEDRRDENRHDNGEHRGHRDDRGDNFDRRDRRD